MKIAEFTRSSKPLFEIRARIRLHLEIDLRDQFAPQWLQSNSNHLQALLRQAYEDKIEIPEAILESVKRILRATPAQYTLETI